MWVFKGISKWQRRRVHSIYRHTERESIVYRVFYFCQHVFARDASDWMIVLYNVCVCVCLRKNSRFPVKHLITDCVLKEKLIALRRKMWNGCNDGAHNSLTIIITTSSLLRLHESHIIYTLVIG